MFGLIIGHTQALYGALMNALVCNEKLYREELLRTVCLELWEFKSLALLFKHSVTQLERVLLLVFNSFPHPSPSLALSFLCYMYVVC